MVLVEVAVGPLRAVEQVHLVFCVGGRGGHLSAVGVGGGVCQAGGFAEETYAAAVPEAEEAGADCAEDDVAVQGGLW